MTPKNPNRISAGRIGYFFLRTVRPALRASFAVVALLLAAGLLAGACGYNSESELQRAADAWDSGDYERSVALYEHYLEHRPDGETSLRARFKLANIYFANLHRYDRAAGHYREFLNQSGPGESDTRVVRERLAESLSELGRSYEAIAEYENITPLDQIDRRRIRLRIADLYFDQKNYSQALTEYNKITDNAAYDEVGENAYLREASIYQLERKQYQQALPIYQKLAAETTDAKVRTRALYNIDDCYTNLFQFDEAIRALREIKDPAEQAFVARRINEREQQNREAARSLAAGRTLMK
jgi:tetratricopeptide (TPR) repeat protein